ncbi:MAG: DUF4382 domain-containing protein [Planctomycetota bacterium]|jgi:hypothetical protein
MRRALLLVLQFLLLASCGIGEPDFWAFQSGSVSTGGTNSGGLTAVAIWTSDSPLDELETVHVSFERVELTRGEESLVLLDRRRGMDLLELQNGLRRLLADGRVEPGTYNTLRIRLASGGGLPHFIERGGELIPLFLAAGASRELVFDGPFRLRPNQELELQLDFNVRLSVYEANGVWYLAPVGTLHDPRVAGAFEGTALPAGTRVSAQVDGREIASTTSGPDGYFRIFPLLGGRYDLVASRSGHTPALRRDLTLQRETTSGGHHFLLTQGADSGSVSGVYFSVGGRGLVVRMVWRNSLIGIAGVDPDNGQFRFPQVPAGEVDFEIWDAAGPLGERKSVLVESGIDSLLEFD